MQAYIKKDVLIVKPGDDFTTDLYALTKWAKDWKMAEPNVGINIVIDNGISGGEIEEDIYPIYPK